MRDGGVIGEGLDAAFARMGASVEAAAARRPELVREARYAVGGRPVRVRCVGPRLMAGIDAAWAHLRSDDLPASPDGLLVELWDERESGTAADPPPRCLGASGPSPLEVSADGRFVGHRSGETRAWFDRATSHVIARVGDSARLSGHERGRPLETPILIWLRDQGVQLVHAAFVSRGMDGVLVVGRSGAGKSTCALACLQAGFDFLGDDKLGLSASADGTDVGHSLTGSLHLEHDNLARFPTFARRAVRDAPLDDGKCLLLLSEMLPARLRRCAAIRAVVTVRVAPGEPSGFEHASRGDVLVATALSTVLHLPIDGQWAMSRLAGVVTRVPVYRLTMGHDVDRIPWNVGAILADALAS